MCSFDNLAHLALIVCLALEKLRLDVAQLVGMQRYLWASYTMIQYLRDGWAQYLREYVLEGEFIRLEWKSLTSLSSLFVPS